MRDMPALPPDRHSQAPLRGVRANVAVAFASLLALAAGCSVWFACSARAPAESLVEDPEHNQCKAPVHHGDSILDASDAPRYAAAAGALCSAVLAVAMHLRQAASAAAAAARDIFRLLSSVALSVYAWLRREAIVRPLRSLYMKGFGWGSIGGWGGASPAHICASLTVGSNPTFWTSTAEAARECDAMIERRYQSVLVVAEYAMLLYATLRVIGLVASHVAVVGPVVREMRALRREIGHAAAMGSTTPKDVSDPPSHAHARQG